MELALGRDQPFEQAGGRIDGVGGDRHDAVAADVDQFETGTGHGFIVALDALHCIGGAGQTDNVPGASGAALKALRVPAGEIEATSVTMLGVNIVVVVSFAVRALFGGASAAAAGTSTAIASATAQEDLRTKPIAPV